jgi:hypothetical protein
MRFFLLCSLVLFAAASFGQRNCGSMDYAGRNGITHLYNNNSLPAQSHRDTVTNEILTVPVVFHILYNNSSQNISTAQILSQLKVLNDDFRRMNQDASQTPAAFRPAAADCRIMFCLAQVDPRGRPSSGIIRRQTSRQSFTYDDAMKFTAAGGDDAWDSRKYLNVWICNMQGGSLGYATPPGSPADKDGVVIQFNAFGTIGNLQANFNKGRTTTHEVAHWMGLKHIWGDATCGDDGIYDTPQQEYYHNGCPSFPQMSACSPNNNGDMYMNFMDYTHDACMNLFTHGQKVKMRGVFAVNGPRNSFLFSFACDSTLATGAPLPQDTTTIINDSTTSIMVEKDWMVYPNPVLSSIYLQGINGYELKGQSVTIFSMTGTLLHRIQLNSSNPTVNLSFLKPGVYLIRVGEGKMIKQRKIIKT